MENLLNNGAKHEVLAFYRVPTTGSTKSKNIVSQMPISPEVFEISENAVKIDKIIAEQIHKNLIQSIKKLASDIDERKVEYWLHEFLEVWEKDAGGNDFRNTFTISKLPLTFN